MSEHFDLDLFLRVLQGLLTPLIGICTVYIAYQQYIQNKIKTRADLYEKRKVVYSAIQELLIATILNNSADSSDMQKFFIGTSNAEFLFPKDIPIYLSKLRKMCRQLNVANEQYRDNTQQPHPPNYDHQQVCDDMHQALTWLAEQHENGASDKFKPYLSIV